MAEEIKDTVAVEAAPEAPAKKAAAKKPAAKKAPAKKADAEKKPAAKKASKKAPVQELVTIELIKSLNGRVAAQKATAASLGLKKIGDKTVQPNNAATQGKIEKIFHLIAVSKA